MRDLAGALCFAIGVLLVMIEAADWFVVKFKKAPQTATIQVDLPGGDVVKAIAEKAPRLGAALAFFILGEVINGHIALSTATSTG